MQDGDDEPLSGKECARSKYMHGRLPLFSNKTRGARTCMLNVHNAARVCDAKGLWMPSRTSQAAHNDAVSHLRASPDHISHRRRSSGSMSDDSGRASTPERMHYERHHQHAHGQKEALREKRLSHHRDRIQRRAELADGL